MNTREPTLERCHTSAKGVRSFPIKSQDCTNMKDCTLDSSHILDCMIEHLLAGLGSASQLFSHYNEHMKLL